MFFFFVFFFQAEDGIRDGTVTGVQTCALPISGELDRVLGQSLRAAPCDVGLLAAHALGPPCDGQGRSAGLSAYSVISCRFACSAKCSSSKRIRAGVNVGSLAPRSAASLSTTFLVPPGCNCASTTLCA